MIRNVKAIPSFPRFIFSVGLLVSFFALPSNSVSAADGKLTNENARQAVLQFLNCASKNPPCTIDVQGVLEIPQQNMARADVMVSNVTLALPKNDAVTAYAFGSGGGTRLWSGSATAIFAHYNDGRWVMTQLIKAEGGSWDNLNIVVRQDGAPSLTESTVTSPGASPTTNQRIYVVQDGPISGRGTYTLTDGAQYRGDVVDGKPHGRGVLTTSSGIRREGQFVDGSFLNGVTIYADGSRSEWRNGQPAVAR